MPEPLLRTKLLIPPLRPRRVARLHLIDRLVQGLQAGYKLTLVSAPAGFGKTTLIVDWVAGGDLPAAWLSLDEGDNDVARFLAYLLAAVQSVLTDAGRRATSLLQSSQPPPTEAVLTALVNEIAGSPSRLILVLDDYHAIQSALVDQALGFLLAHAPPQLHLAITTREDPDLPLARLRARGQLTELRAADLRFNLAEGGAFLNEVMGLDLAASDVAALENRTEGWIAGLQLAALSLRGHEDSTAFIDSFTGSHQFVLDYLVSEVLDQQSEAVRRFLLRTSILDRLCGPLCDAVLGSAPGHGRKTLAYLDQANLFVIPLDSERRWYRYHHLFADLLRQRLHEFASSTGASEGDLLVELHRRSSAWYEANGLVFEAFGHAAAANDVDRAERLIEGEGMPLQFRGMVNPILDWLATLPEAVLAARPSLAVTYASALTMTGRLSDSVEDTLRMAEAALEAEAPDDRTRDLLGHIAAIRAMLAVPRNELETIIAESQRALALLRLDNLPVRTTTAWTLGYAYQLRREWAAASRAYADASAVSQASGNVMVTIAAMTCLGQVEEAQTQLKAAAETYRRVLELTGDPPWPAACEAYLGLARLHYQWDELDVAQAHAERSVALAKQLLNVDTPVAGIVLLARIKLAQGDPIAAARLLDEAEQFAQRHGFAHWLPEIAAVRVLVLLRRGDVAAAAGLADKHALAISQARVCLVDGDPAAALALLLPLRRQAESTGWSADTLQVLVLEAVARQAGGDREGGVAALTQALTLAEPGGFFRLFLDEGFPLEALLEAVARQGAHAPFVGALHGSLKAPGQDVFPEPALTESLTEREADVLRLLSTDLSGPQIADELVVSLNTLRTHTKNIYGKLGVHNRRAAVRRARELGLL